VVVVSLSGYIEVASPGQLYPVSKFFFPLVRRQAQFSQILAFGLTTLSLSLSLSLS
jgi:hypothetical protein